MDFKKFRNQPVDELTMDMYKMARKDNVDTIYERFANQQPQCGFGSRGVCCTLCTDGPCQITRKANRGVCGASADLIVTRNLLFKCAQGTAANVYHARNVAKTLQAVGEGKADYTIKEEGKLRDIAGRLGIEGSRPVNEIAREFGPSSSIRSIVMIMTRSGLSRHWLRRNALPYGRVSGSSLAAPTPKLRPVFPRP